MVAPLCCALHHLLVCPLPGGRMAAELLGITSGQLCVPLLRSEEIFPRSALENVSLCH